MSNNVQVEVQPEEQGKVGKAFEENIKKLEAILGGKDKLYSKKRVKPTAVEGIVADLFKEENTAIELEVKDGLKGLLKEHQAYLAFIKQKEDEFAKLKEDKQKEFNSTAQKLFGKLDNIPEIMKNYAASLALAAGQ